MLRYTIIDTNQSHQETFSMLIDFFSDLMHIDHYEEKKHRLIIYYQSHEKLNLKAMIYAMIAETYQDLRLYQSHTFDDQEALNAHVIYMEKQLDLIAFNTYTYIDDHIFLKHHLTHKLPIDHKKILRKYSNRSDIHHTIKTFLECNQNINQAAKELYIHRNTLLQRLDKFHQATGFDVKRFLDAFIIYQIL